MASSNKTENFALNKWVGTDCPQRSDFVSDNEIIDEELFNHVSDSTAHLSEDEKSKLISPFYVGTYMGNGAASREITIPFSPGLVILFPTNRPIGVADFNTRTKENMLALATTAGSCWGVSLTGGVLTVENSSQAQFGGEFKQFNMSGTLYTYVAFK